VMNANAALAEDGSLKDAKLHERVEALGAKLAQVLTKLHA